MRAFFRRALLPGVSLLLWGCASRTVIHSVPEGADILVDEQFPGKTPFAYADAKVRGSETRVHLRMDGYRALDTAFRRDERIAWPVLLGGPVPALLWFKGYDSARTYRLVPGKTDSATLAAEKEAARGARLARLAVLAGEESRYSARAAGFPWGAHFAAGLLLTTVGLGLVSENDRPDAPGPGHASRWIAAGVALELAGVGEMVFAGMKAHAATRRDLARRRREALRLWRD